MRLWAILSVVFFTSSFAESVSQAQTRKISNEEDFSITLKPEKKAAPSKGKKVKKVAQRTPEKSKTKSRSKKAAVTVVVNAKPVAAKKNLAAMKPFIDGLMAKMTDEEKIGQLVQYTADMAVTGASMRENYRKDIESGMVGSIFNAYTPAFTRELQETAVTKTRMKIPLLFGHDVIHGHRTIFPIPLAESSTWDFSLMEKSARIAAIEAAADGINWTFAPMVDISRDPRWGRVSEGAGEDPWLASKIGAARVKGFQGKNLADKDSVLATVKHFAAYGAPMGGRDYNSVDLSERELAETYLPPYEAAVKAGAATVMASFNEISGVPSSANKSLLTDLLRTKWDFKGFTVADYTSINELIPHGFAADGKEASRLAFNAGLDMDMQGGLYAKELKPLLKEGKISKTALDAATRRVLEAKFKLGLFEDPYRGVDQERADRVLMSQDHLTHARQIAKRSIVLLKNDVQVLPLKRESTIALIGPFIDNKRDQIGNWSSAGDGTKAVSLFEGLSAAMGDKGTILKARGANVMDDFALLKFLNEHQGQIELDERKKEEMLREAVNVARKSDVIVLALGETQGMSGEAASRAHLRLPETQQDLLTALSTTGKPIVLVLFNGRPLVLKKESTQAKAIVEAWFLGTQAGHAIADVLFGDYNPSGKLTMSFPADEGQIPIFYSEKSTGRPFDAKQKYTSKYLDIPNEPLYPFGWGLSYTNFTISAPELSSASMTKSQNLKVTVTVQNTGDYDGEETVQLYIRDMVGSITRPVKQLRGFRKVYLAKGESQKITFELKESDLRFYGPQNTWISEPGEFKVMVGPNSADLQETIFRLR